MQRLLTAIISLVILIGCKSLEIKSANKQNFNSGRPNGSSGINFSVVFSISNSSQINSVSLHTESKSKSFSEFELYKLNNGEILKPNEVLIKGKYQIQIRTSKENDHFNYITINYTTKGNKKSVRKKIDRKDKLLMK